MTRQQQNQQASPPPVVQASPARYNLPSSSLSSDLVRIDLGTSWSEHQLTTLMQESQSRQEVSNSRNRRARRSCNSYTLAEWTYDVDDVHRHRDALGREWVGVPDDRFLSYLDARPRKLIVQTAEALYDNHGDTTYGRTHVRNVTPWMLRLAFWAIEGKGNSSDPWLIFARCLATTLPLTVLVSPISS